MFVRLKDLSGADHICAGAAGLNMQHDLLAGDVGNEPPAGCDRRVGAWLTADSRSCSGCSRGAWRADTML